MPSNNKATIEADDLSTLMICSERYALGRQTYIVSDVCAMIKKYIDHIEDRAVCCMERDIREAPSYGDRVIDSPVWMHILDMLQKEIEKRGARKW